MIQQSQLKSKFKSFDLLMLDLKVEVSTEPVIEEGLLNITRRL